MTLTNLPTIQPLELIRWEQPSNHPDWVWEIKQDGFQALAYIGDGNCWLASRKGKVYAFFPALRPWLAIVFSFRGP